MKKIVFIVLALIWTVSPLDGDIVPGYGWIDDLIIDLLALIYCTKAEKREMVSAVVKKKKKFVKLKPN